MRTADQHWDDCLDLAFTEITSFGASSPQVARRRLPPQQALRADSMGLG